MTNIFSNFKNINDQLSNAPSNMLLRCLVMFLHFYTYAFENAQKAMSCMIPIYQSGVFSQNVDFIRSDEASIRMLDTVLEHQNAILLIFESRRNIRVSLGNTWSTSVDLIVD